MNENDIQEIKDLLNNDSDKWRIDAGDWMGYVEELIGEIDRLKMVLEIIAEDETDYPRKIAKDALEA